MPDKHYKTAEEPNTCRCSTMNMKSTVLLLLIGAVYAVEGLRCYHCANTETCKPMDILECPKNGTYMCASAYADYGVDKGCYPVDYQFYCDYAYEMNATNCYICYSDLCNKLWD